MEKAEMKVKGKANWLHPDVLDRLVKLVTSEFSQETYNINKVARNCMDGMTSIDKKNFEKQVLTFVQLLGALPRYFVELLN